MKDKSIARLTAFLRQLEESRISYTLAHNRDEAVMVQIAVPGERWEVEFLDDGSVEIERFKSTGAIEDESAIVELLERYSDSDKRTGKRSIVSADLAKAMGISVETAKRLHTKAVRSEH